VEKILRMGIGLFVGIWVARYLGPAQYGLLSYAHSFVGLFAAIASLGLDGVVVRELVKQPAKEKEILGTAFVLKLIGAVLMFAALYLAVDFVSDDKEARLLIFIIAGGVVFQSFNIIDIYFQAKVMSKYAVFANSFSLLLSSMVKIVLILYSAPLIAFAWVVVFESAVMALGYVYFFLKHTTFEIQRLVYKGTMAISLLKDSWPLILSGIAVSVYMKIDQVMIKEMLDSQAVGNYAAAVKLSEAWYFIPVAISTSLFPAIINAKKVSEKLYYQRLQKLYDLAVWIAIAIALPMTFLSDWIVNFLYGSRYEQAGSVLMIHVWSGLFVFLGMVASKWVVSENLLQNALVRTILGAILNIILNYYFIKAYGIVGVALATLISYFFVNYFSLFFYKKTRKCFIQQTKALNIFRALRGQGEEFDKKDHR